MPNLRIKAENISAEQIDEISGILFKQQYKGVHFMFKIRPDLSKEVIEGLGWEYIKTDEVGKMYFEFGVWNLVFSTDNTVTIDEGTMDVRFSDKVKTEKQLKKAMRLFAII